VAQGEWGRKAVRRKGGPTARGPVDQDRPCRAGPEGNATGAHAAWRAGVGRPVLEGAEFQRLKPSSPVQARFSPTFAIEVDQGINRKVVDL
jgi:hypothetical protein